MKSNCLARILPPKMKTSLSLWAGQSACFPFCEWPESLTLLVAIGLFFAFLWIGTEVFDKVETFRKALRGFLSSAFNPPATGEIELWFVLIAVLFAGLLFVSSLDAMSTGLFTRSLRKNFRNLKAAYKDLKRNFGDVSTERDRLNGQLPELIRQRDALLDAVSASTKQTETMQAILVDERQSAKSALDTLTRRANAQMNETVGAVSMIARQLFPAASKKQGKTIRSASITYHISKTFDAEVHRRYVIRAGDVPLHFWQSSLSASGDAQPAASLTDVGYQLLSRTPGREVAFLPSENIGYKKKACLFFLPLVMPGEEREIEFVYRWPGLMLGMMRVGWEDFNFSFNSAETMEDFELEVFLEDGSGGHLNLTEVGVPLPHRSIGSAKNDRGWQGWRYAGKNLPPTLLDNDIVARLEWRRS
jgi:hypothetical protein